MSKSLPGSLLGLAVLALVSNSWEGTVRAGAWAGFLLGLGVGCAVVGWQAGACRRNPRKALEFMALGFLMKLFVLASCGIALRFWPPLSARFDSKAFLVSAALGMILLLVLGTFDNARILRASASQALSPDPKQPSPGAPFSKGNVSQ